MEGSAGWFQGNVWVLQGYYDSQIDLMIVDMSDRQLYKQAGNGVTVNVVEAIGRNLKAVDEELKLEDSVYAH